MKKYVFWVTALVCLFGIMGVLSLAVIPLIIVITGSHRYYLDGYLKSNLDALKHSVIKKNHDGFILISAREGFGKTTLGLQVITYLDPTFDLSRVCFTPEQFLEAVENAEKFQGILFDETMWALGSRNAMSRINKVLIKVMSEMRSKNLFVVMCIPSFFMMDWYVAQHRSTGLLYISKRGHLASYDYPTKKKLYLKGKKYHTYSVSPNFIGRFTKYFPVNQEEYDKKKQKAINSWIKHKQSDSGWKEQRDLLINKCVEEKLMKRTEIAELLGISLMQVGRIVT
jgi:hypothetical protein